MYVLLLAVALSAFSAPARRFALLVPVVPSYALLPGFVPLSGLRGFSFSGPGSSLGFAFPFLLPLGPLVATCSWALLALSLAVPVHSRWRLSFVLWLRLSRSCPRVAFLPARGPFVFAFSPIALSTFPRIVLVGFHSMCGALFGALTSRAGPLAARAFWERCSRGLYVHSLLLSLDAVARGSLRRYTYVPYITVKLGARSLDATVGWSARGLRRVLTFWCTLASRSFSLWSRPPSSV